MTSEVKTLAIFFQWGTAQGSSAVLT